MNRNLSMEVFFGRLAAGHVPRYRFDGATPDDWRTWREALLPAAVATLGPMPDKIDPDPEVIAEWAEGGLGKRKFGLGGEEGLSAEGYLFRPEKIDGKLPGILACHGHGQFGKEAVMGNRSAPEIVASIESGNYDYGLQMAKSGYAVVSIDWRGFGNRDARRTPPYTDVIGQRDPCNLNFVRASLLGRTLLGMDVHDGQCALDYLCGQEFVDADHIGVMGLSFGGTMTTWMSMVDERIKAADIICYSDRFAHFAFRDGKVCGSQITPGLYALADLPDLHGLTAPRPLLVEIGLHDLCFKVDAALSCYREVEKIYAAAGASERLELDLFEGSHGWGANKSVAFFGKYL